MCWNIGWCEHIQARSGNGWEMFKSWFCAGRVTSRQFMCWATRRDHAGPKVALREDGERTHPPTDSPIEAGSPAIGIVTVTSD